MFHPRVFFQRSQTVWQLLFDKNAFLFLESVDSMKVVMTCHLILLYGFVS